MIIQRVSVILGLFACLPLISSAGQGVQARFDEELQKARSLTNVEIQMLDTSIYPASPKEEDFSSTFLYTYIASGPKFRATCKLVSATQTDTRKLSEAAFNGTSFVTYNADTRSMTRGDEIPGSDSGEFFASPLIAPFLFLAKNSDNCPTCQLRFTDVVSPDFAKGLILPRGRQSNGLLYISMPGLPLGKKAVSWQIGIDEAGDTFAPKTVQMIIEAGGEIVWKLLNYTNLGGYHFPTRVEITGSAYPPTSPPTVLSTETVTVISARIPDRVADSVFSLDDEEKAAATVWDADKQTFSKSGPPSESCPRYQRLHHTAEQQASTNIQPAITNRPSPGSMIHNP